MLYTLVMRRVFFSIVGNSKREVPLPKDLTKGHCHEGDGGGWPLHTLGIKAKKPMLTRRQYKHIGV